MTVASQRVAHGIIVFGRGHEPGYVDRLSAASLARVERAVGYVSEHAEFFSAQPGVLVFSGGWAGAAGAVTAPPEELREGNLMLDKANGRSIHGVPITEYARMYAEADSASTLENVLRVHEYGFFADAEFDEAHPLGLVAHRGHIDRADYYCRKVFQLKRSALLHIVAEGGDQLSAGLPEPLMNVVTRLSCIGARRPEALRRRERALIAVTRALRVR